MGIGNNSMDKLLGQLKFEMLELRDRSDNLAKQMWLLYVTFEDFVCLNHSEKSKNLFKTSVNIDNYLKSPNTTPKTNVYKKSTDKEVNITDLKTYTKNHNNQSIILKSELIVCSQDNPGTCSKTISADLTDNEITKNCCKEITVGYQIAYIQRLGRLHKNNNKCLNTKITCNGVNQCNSMEVEPSYRSRHKADKMHYLNGHNSRNNKRCNKSSNCADIIRVDKQAYFKDKVSDSTNQPKSLLSEEGGLKHQQIRTQLGDNYRCKRYNPILNISNNCLNRPDDRLSASAMVNVNGCVLDPRVRTLPDTVSKFKLSDKNPLSLPIKQCWKDNRSLENLSDSSKSSNDLKRSVLSPLEHAKPEQARSPKRHCIYMSSKLNYDLLLGENVHQDEKSLSDSFENVLNETQDSKSQFDDILLKDVESEMSVANPCDASPMTISSGYESDSMQTCEAEIDHIFIRSKNKNVKKVNEPTTPTDYFSMSDSLPGGNETKMVADEHVQNVKRVVPDKAIAKEIAKQNIQNVLSSKVQADKIESSNPARFSPVQRQNYQLTKVARSMFEIIHDLQSDDESSDPNKKKFRKVRRTHSKDMDTDVNQKQSGTGDVTNENENTQTCDQKSDNLKAADDQSRMSIKCLRKPLGSEPSRFAMGRKNPKNIFMSNNPDNGKRKDRQEPRGPQLGEARILKQIGELPFDPQNDSLRRRNPNSGSNKVHTDVGNVRARGPSSRIQSTGSEFRPICEPRESEARVPPARPTSLSNFPQRNNLDAGNRNLRPHPDFKRQTSYEPPRTVQNVEQARRHSKDNLLHSGSRESLVRYEFRDNAKTVENIRRNSKDNLLQSDSKDNLSQTGSRDSFSQNGSRDNLSRNSPRDSCSQNSSRDNLSQNSSRDNLSRNSPRDSLPQNDSRDNFLRNDSRDNLLVNNHPSAAFSKSFTENQNNIVPVHGSAQDVPKPFNENQNRAVLLRGSRPLNGFQDPHLRQIEQMNDNRPPLHECLNSFQGNVPLWSCNTRMQIIDTGCSPYATTRIPGCQTPRRDEKDDHVYETIPGDEVLYEEILRLRMKGILFPRFHNGKFVPFEPPALPARNGLRDMNTINKQNNIPRDINSNFQPTRASFNVPINTDLIPADLKSRMRSASWDGYSKIDNDNVLSDRILHPNFNPANFVNRIDGIIPPPPKRRENFYLLLSNKQKRADFSHSLELETKLKGLGIVLNDKNVNRLHVDNYETVDNFDVVDPPEDIPLQFLQSTYV